MSYFAEIKDGIVQRVIVADQEFIDSGSAGDPNCWVETFDNRKERKNFAAPGYTYDSDRDVFLEPKPFDSWTLNEEKGQWEAPAKKPQDEVRHYWDEKELSWVNKSTGEKAITP